MEKRAEKKVKNKEENKEKSVGLLQMLRQFWDSDEEEISQVEEISRNEAIEAKNREMLLKSLKIADSIVKPTEVVAVKPSLSKLKIGSDKLVVDRMKRNSKQVNLKVEKEKKNEDEIQEIIIDK